MKRLRLDAIQRLYVEDKLGEAFALLAENDVTNAIRHGVDAYVFFLRAVAPSIRDSGTLLNRHLVGDWPQLGVKLHVGDESIDWSFEQETFNSSVGGIYLSFIRDRIARGIHARLVNEAAIPERIASGLSALSVYAAARVPLGWNTFRSSLVRTHLQLFRVGANSKLEYEQKVHAIADFLGEPFEVARKIFEQHTEFSCLRQAQTLRTLKNPELVDVISREIVWADERDYAEFAERDRGSRLLTTIHLGNFWHGLVRFASHSEPGRAAISIRSGLRNRQEDVAYQAFKRLGTQYTINRDGDMPTVEIIRQLRKGGATLSGLFDLGSDFGQTTEVTFFGKQAHFARGPIELAVISRIPIVPFICFRERNTDYIKTHDVIETSLQAGETLQDATQRIAQRLVSFAESWIRSYPYQWQFLIYGQRYFNAWRRT